MGLFLFLLRKDGKRPGYVVVQVCKELVSTTYVNTFRRYLNQVVGESKIENILQIAHSSVVQESYSRMYSKKVMWTVNPLLF
jgi:hypothetical protein